MSNDDLTYRIGKLAPKPGEIVVLKAKGHLSLEMVEILREQMRAAFAHAGHPDQTVMILGDDLDLMLIDPRDCGPQPPPVALDRAQIAQEVAEVVRAIKEAPQPFVHDGKISAEAATELMRTWGEVRPGQIQPLDRLDWRSQAEEERFVNPPVMARFCAERGCEWRGCHEVDRFELIEVTEPGDIYRVYMVSGSGGKLVTLGEAIG